VTRVGPVSMWGPNAQGVRSRPDRSVVLEVGDRNPEALSLDVPLLSAQSSAPQVDPTAYSGGDGWRDHFSDFLKSRVGQLLGSGSLPELQRGVAQDLAGLAMPPTPGGQMAAPKVAGYVEGALDLGRPLALADLGVSGPGGMMMLPFPGLGAADDVARPVVKMGRGVTEDALRGMREALKRADSGSLASFWDEAKAGRIRSGIPVRGEQHELWSVAESAQNHVGMGRLAGYSEADIKRWYLHNAIADSLSNPGVMAEFDGMTGLKRGDVVASNQERVKNVSSAVLARARAQYERDLFSWDKTVDAAQATSQVAKVADAAAGHWVPKMGVPEPSSPPPSPSSVAFRTEKSWGANNLITPSKSGSSYVRNTDGSISRFGVRDFDDTSVGLVGPKGGWHSPRQYVYVPEEVGVAAKAAAGIPDQMRHLVRSSPEVGLHPLSLGPTMDTTHLGDAIVEVFG